MSSVKSGWALMILIVCLPAFAMELHKNFEPRVELGKTESWSAYRLLDNNKVNLQFETGKVVKIFKPPFASSFLASAKTVTWKGKAYLMTSWQEGVSTVALRVFDPAANDKPLLFEQYSVGDMQIEITAAGLKLSVAEPGQSPLEPREREVNWSAP